MRLDIKKGIQLLTGRADPEAGRKIADLDAGEQAASAASQPAAPQPAAPPAPSSALRPTAPISTAASRADASDAPRPDASEADWGELLVRLLASAPEDVAQKLVGCLDREVIARALERRSDPYLKVALLLLKR
jgi:hypothetical protein